MISTYNTERLAKPHGFFAAGSLNQNDCWHVIRGENTTRVRGLPWDTEENEAALHECMFKAATMLKSTTEKHIRVVVGNMTIVGARDFGDGSVIGVVLFTTGDEIAKSARRLLRRCAGKNPSQTISREMETGT